MKQNLKIWLIALLSFSSFYVRANTPGSFEAGGEENPSLVVSKEDSVKLRRKLTNLFRFKAGLLTSSFYRPNLSESNGILSDPLMGWHVGLSSDILKRKYHYSKIELSYISKGAREFFATDGLDIEAVTRLQYVQLAVLPVVLKSEFRKLNPSVGVGLYYAQRVKASSKTGYNSGSLTEDPVSLSFFNVNQDFGLVLNLEVMYKKRPGIEIRYEAGFKSQSTLRSIKNRALVFSFVI